MLLVSASTEDRILALMAKGAKLWFKYHYHPDFGTELVEVTLDYHHSRLILSHIETLPNVRWGSEGPFTRLVSPLSRDFVKRPDIRQGYCYNSDYGSAYREVYEHIMTSVPRWVTEQVGWDNNGQFERVEDFNV